MIKRHSLVCLPAEIRLKIWQAVLEDESMPLVECPMPDNLQYGVHRDRPHVQSSRILCLRKRALPSVPYVERDGNALMSTCRQIYYETLPLYNRRRLYTFHTAAHLVDAANTWSGQCVSSMRCARIDFDDPGILHFIQLSQADDLTVSPQQCSFRLTPWQIIKFCPSLQLDELVCVYEDPASFPGQDSVAPWSMFRASEQCLVDHAKCTQRSECGWMDGPWKRLIQISRSPVAVCHLQIRNLRLRLLEHGELHVRLLTTEMPAPEDQSVEGATLGLSSCVVNIEQLDVAAAQKYAIEYSIDFAPNFICIVERASAPRALSHAEAEANARETFKLRNYDGSWLQFRNDPNTVVEPYERFITTRRGTPSRRPPRRPLTVARRIRFMVGTVLLFPIVVVLGLTTLIGRILHWFWG